MEWVAGDVHGGEFLVGDFDFLWVGSVVELGVDLQSGAGRRGGDQVDDDLVTDQRLAAPVGRDEAEQAMLDLVPLARAWREMADGDLPVWSVSFCSSTFHNLMR